MMEICRKRAAWGTYLGLFGGNYAWYFLLDLDPRLLPHRRGITPSTTSPIFASIPLWVTGFSTLFSGLVSDRLIARGCDRRQSAQELSRRWRARRDHHAAGRAGVEFHVVADPDFDCQPGDRDRIVQRVGHHAENGSSASDEKTVCVDE